MEHQLSFRKSNGQNNFRSSKLSVPQDGQHRFIRFTLHQQEVGFATAPPINFFEKLVENVLT